MNTTEPIVHGSADWRTRNVGRLLFAATDLFVRQKLTVLRDGGFAGVSEAGMALVLHLERDGTRLTTLAQRAGQTKQSMIELVDRAEVAGIVTRSPDPDDARAKVVRFTPEGVRMLALLERGMRDAERRFADVVGNPFLGELKARLGRYVGLAEEGAAEAGWRERSAGRLLSFAARRFARDLLRFVHERGYREVTQVLLALFRNLDLGGTRLTDLAARARMTKQSMRELIERAEALELVARCPDPADRRAKLVMFTPEGLTMLDAMRRGVGLAESQLGREVGEAFARALPMRLAEYIVADAP